MQKLWAGTSEDIDNFYFLVNPDKARYAITAPPPRSTLEAILGIDSAKRATIAHIETIIGSTAKLGTTPKQRYDNYLLRVMDTPYGKWLHANEGFKKAHALFRKKQQGKKSFAYNLEWAELRFLYCCISMGECAIGLAARHKPPAPSSRVKVQAIKHIKALRQCLDRGIRLDAWSENQNFKAMLEKLHSELSANAGQRKTRADANYVGRKFVEIVSRSLLREFGEASPGIVKSLAEGMGYRVDESAMDAQIAAIRKKHASTDSRTTRKISKKSA